MKKKDTTEFSSVKKYQQVILSVAIAIVLVAFVMYGVSVFYEQPVYDKYCRQELQIKGYESQEECEKIGGLWNSRAEQCPAELAKCPRGWCDPHYTCRQQYDDVRKVYERNVFLMVSVLGLGALVLGLALKLAAVSAGISIGGVVLIAFAIIRYWSEFGKYVRLLLLALLLVALIFIAYRKFGNK
ncbi:MAG: hypothetical protein HY363_02570 [Candidatus Aenigmarchaeota archaeon]|nr:hypothetical protein [Candidatus Aenigmarchaeota archaeon]